MHIPRFVRGAMFVYALGGAVAPMAQTAPSIVLSWQYTPNPLRPGVSIVAQRCIQQGTTCAVAMADVGKVPVSAVTFTDTTVQAGTGYCYQVLTEDATGRSAPSTQACAAVPVPQILNTPTQLQLRVQ